MLIHVSELWTYVKRGARSCCPACGQGKLFASWNVLNEHCLDCQTPFQAREDETWFFMYMSTAAMTGLFVIGMFLITPRNFVLGKYLIAFLAIILFVVTTAPRKGIAIAIDYYIDQHSEHPRN